MLRLETEEPEGMLAERACRGDRRALTELFERHYSGVLTLALRLLRDSDAARDAAQEAFLRALAQLKQYDWNYRFASWLFKVLVNHIRDQKRRGDRSVELDPDVLPASAPADPLVREEDLGRIRAEMLELPEEARLAVLLHLQEGLTGPEIAYALGITPQAARLRICRGLARLRERLKETP
jgi:RNA polymerase sigma-70 factor (ECF subfamily)